MSIIGTGAVWLHLVATVVLLGYFAVLTLFVLPVLTRALAGAALGTTVAAIERRALPFVIASLVAFLASGIYMAGSDTRYSGAGSIDSPWATIVLVKHGVIVGMLAVAAYVDALAVRAGSSADDVRRASAIRRFTLGSGVLTALGLVVLLLTAVAQAS
jgi:uncharacterized membrane protein